MLTQKQRTILAKAASEKYSHNIAPAQINHLVLDNFECKFCYHQNKNCIIGNVQQFLKFPLKIDFHAPEESQEREAFNNQLQQNSNLEFSCKLSSVSHTVKVNTLAISSSEFQQMGIRKKLLGSASTAYVTREQLNHLARKLHTTLNVAEEYEMPEYQFQQFFVEDFIRLATTHHFQHVPALQALKKLSPYRIDFGKNLEPGKPFTFFCLLSFFVGISIQDMVPGLKLMTSSSGVVCHNH
jgi:hypothetical protein